MIRHTYLTALFGALFILVGCPTDDPADDDTTGDDDVGDDDTGDDDSGDDDTGDDDTGDDDTSDDDTSDDDTEDSCVAAAGITVPTNCPTIQEAIDIAPEGAVISVESGTYVENIDFSGKAIHILGVDGPGTTIIEGSGGNAVVLMDSQESNGSVLEGFTIRDGLQWGISVGMASSPRLTNLIVTENSPGWPDNGYGGLMVNGGAPEVSYVMFRANGSDQGLGVYLEESSATLTNVSIESNNGNGVVHSNEDTAMLTNVIIADNSGGGVFMVDSAPSFTNVIVVDNAEGGFFTMDSAPALTNVIVSSNTGHGVSMMGGSPTMTNVLASSNTASGVHVVMNSTPALSHCNVWGNAFGEYGGMDDQTGISGNISVDPDLIDTSDPDPLSWDLHLSATSLLIDAGDPMILDPDGLPSDIGAYGGPGAAGFDLDFDGYFEWWLPGSYDPATSPGMDCDDGDPALYPGNGC